MVLIWLTVQFSPPHTLLGGLSAYIFGSVIQETAGRFPEAASDANLV